MKSPYYIAIACLLSLCGISTAYAETISLQQLIKTVIAKSPELQVSQIDAAISDSERSRIEGTLDSQLSARASASEDTSPVVSSFQATSTQSSQFSTTLSQPLANGDTAAINIIYDRTKQRFNSPFASQLARYNPAYRGQINFSYRHPLLKGHNRPSYHQALLASDATSTATRLQQRIIARSLALQCTNIYFQLAADEINIRIAEQAVKRARTLLSYQRSREQFGLIEKADRLQAEALLALRKTDLQRAKSRRLVSQNQLNRLMLQRSDLPLTITPPKQQSITITDINTALATATTMRPELQQLQQQLRATEAQLNITKDTSQAQLDLVAEVGTRSLSGKPLTSVANAFQPNTHYIALTVEYSDSLSDKSNHADIRKAELQRDRITASERQRNEQIKSDIYNAITTLQSGKPVLMLARQQAAAEARKFQAEMKRYREGRSDTATLVQFEGALRNAELNAKLQQLTLQLASYQLAWAEGTLLRDMNITIESERSPL